MLIFTSGLNQSCSLLNKTWQAAKPEKDTEEGYGRADKAAAWLLLSRLYLNAEVYTGKAEWAKAKEYAKKVMDSSYKLHTGKTVNGWTAYQQLLHGRQWKQWCF